MRRETAVGELRKQVIEILSSDNKATEYQVSRHRTMFVRLEEGTRRAIAEAATSRAEARREAEEAEKVDFYKTWFNIFHSHFPGQKCKSCS